MISQNKINYLRTNNFEMNIPTQYKDQFWDWFKENGNEFTETLNLGNLASDNDVRIGQCYRNAQLKYLNDNLTYIDGFLVGHNNNVIPHGFNISPDNRVIDFTVSKFPDNFRDSGNSTLPNEYYGVQIPIDLIDTDSIQYDTYNSSLLLTHFINSLD